MGPFPLLLACIPQNIAPNCTVLSFKINCFDIKNEFSYYRYIFIHVIACHIGDNVVGLRQKSLAFRSNHKSLSRSLIWRSRKDQKTACFSMLQHALFRSFPLFQDISFKIRRPRFLLVSAEQIRYRPISSHCFLLCIFRSSRKFSGVFRTFLEPSAQAGSDLLLNSFL